MSDTVRWGVLGAAKIAEVEVGPAILRAERNQVRGVASRRLSTARKLANALQAPMAYGSYEELLADPQIDAVYNALPNALHAQWTVAALEAGKHVLCEKPLGLTANEVRWMTGAAERADRVLMEGFMWRFHPRVRRVLAMIADGTLGELRLVRATYTFDLAAAGDVRSSDVESDIRLNPDLGGGALTDLGSYCISGLRVYSRSRPLTVRSWRRTDGGREVETTVTGHVDFENGVVGQFFAALDIPGGGHVEIVGTAGRIRMENAFRIREAQAPFEIEIQRADGSWSCESTPFVDQYQLELDHFTKVLLDGVEPEISSYDSLDNAATLEAVRRSWRDGDVQVDRG